MRQHDYTEQLSMDSPDVRGWLEFLENNGGTTLTSRFIAPSFTMATQFNGRSNTFTLSLVDITRTGTWVGGVLQGSTLSGTHTLSATLPGGFFDHTVATQGTVTYSATGLPTAGGWTITLPRAIVGV